MLALAASKRLPSAVMVPAMVLRNWQLLKDYAVH